ncbi:type II toxin-antitoxin system PemK/MazF family toxin [Micromonospora sp. SCSIO 07396]|uniref:Type II toxin-antitoxin system PemK/MazF family toxin n=1 Tax=Micromonospora humidisoli TaxID=2807622 RepID=A0ABS2J6L3_9ACTN|nr:type II toxin-antitoxin system PemK/MazF family toxin [Micromonospora humidisoli]MBM7081424.1 type II toxin-antitoxin system PemK/MazF family toxin [Micromonospora humidisoli]
MPQWLLWGLLIVLAVAAGWVWNEWRRRGGRPSSGGGRTRPERGTPPRDRARPTAPPRPRTPTGTPRPGDIWWADVPFHDGTGSKVRPCLVVRADDRGAEVLKITSQDKSDRDDHVPIPTRDWDPDADHDSWLDLAEPLRIPADAFSRRAGSCDPALWRQVKRLHGRRSPA